MKLRALIVLSLVALAAAGVLILTRPAKPFNRLVFYESSGRPGLRYADITLRNVTKETIVYSVLSTKAEKPGLQRKLKAGELDRLATDLPLRVSFNNHARTVDSVVYPGQPYSFRYNEQDLIQVYPGSHGREDAEDLAPYVATPLPVVEKMLEMARLTPDDVLYDIGCGDGRMVIAAARDYGCRGVGIDIDESLIKMSRASAEEEGVAALTRFIAMDATKAHYTEATVLALYLLPESLELLRPLFEKELRPGARIVTHDYSIPGWDEKKVASEEASEVSGKAHRVHLYIK